MNPYYNKLKSMETSIPENYSEKNLETLEDTVDRYNFIINVMAKNDEEDNTQFTKERVVDIEEDLKNAKYGATEKQREKSYYHARKTIIQGIGALMNILKDEEEETENIEDENKENQ